MKKIYKENRTNMLMNLSETNNSFFFYDNLNKNRVI